MKSAARDSYPSPQSVPEGLYTDSAKRAQAVAALGLPYQLFAVGLQVSGGLFGREVLLPSMDVGC